MPAAVQRIASRMHGIRRAEHHCGRLRSPTMAFLSHSPLSPLRALRVHRSILAALLLAAVAVAPATAQPSAAAIAGSVTVGPSGSRISGSGRAADDVRPLAPFTAIRVEGSIDVVLRQTDREQATVRFDDNLLEFVETMVSQEPAPTLVIRFRQNAALRSSRDVKVTVDFKTLSSLSMSGTGDARIETLRGPMLAVSISGSADVKADALDVDVLGVSIGGNGDFTARGRAAEQGFSIAGSGDIRAGDLVGQSVKVRVAGSGDVHVNAQQMLDVSIAGSGDVVYRGSPVIRKSVAGSGNVRKAN